MKGYQVACVAVFAVIIPAAALADDANDSTMRNAAARARDREIIRQLNLQELAKVQERDARYAQGWRAWPGENGNGSAEAANDARSRDYERDMDRYARNRAQYERQMAAWRRTVAACHAGDYLACGTD